MVMTPVDGATNDLIPNQVDPGAVESSQIRSQPTPALPAMDDLQQGFMERRTTALGSIGRT